MQNNGESVFNLGTGHGYSVLDMVHAFEEAKDVVVPYQIAARRQGDLPICYADTSKSTEPVSYTHLDVYKRQPLMTLPSARS